jgi:hypothetical protein
MFGGRWRQGTIWPLIKGDADLPPGLQDVRSFLDTLGECDGALIAALRHGRGPRGRNDYPVEAMWNLAALQLFLRKGRASDLLGELRRNADLARLLGFREQLPADFDLPSHSALSRFLNKLRSDPYLALIKGIQEQTVLLLRREDPAIGKHTALDTSDVRTHGHPARHVDDPQKHKAATDPEASWSIKTKRRTGRNGRAIEETKKTFGYKAALNVDVKHPVVIEAITVSGSANDQHLAMPLLEGSARILGPSVIETCAADKGFDSTDNVVNAYRDHGVRLIVPVRDVPANLEQLSPQDRETALKPGGNVVIDRYSGEVACYEAVRDGHHERRAMAYAGFEADRRSHKFRCPLGEQAATRCSAFQSCSAGRSGKHGRQVRVPMAIDSRRLAPIYPRSKQWKRRYNGRSAVERVNSYLKEVLRLEDHCLRGLKAINLRLLLASVTLNLRTLMVLRAAAAAKAASAKAA